MVPKASNQPLQSKILNGTTMEILILEVFDQLSNLICTSYFYFCHCSMNFLLEF